MCCQGSPGDNGSFTQGLQPRLPRGLRRWDGFLATCSASLWHPGPPPSQPGPATVLPSGTGGAPAQAQGQVEVSGSRQGVLGWSMVVVVPASHVSARSPEASSASCPLLIWVIKSPHLKFLVLLGQEALTFYYAPSPTNYAGIPNATPSGPQTPTVPLPHVPVSSADFFPSL